MLGLGRVGVAALGRSLGLCLTGRRMFRGQMDLKRELSAGWISPNEQLLRTGLVDERKLGDELTGLKLEWPIAKLSKM